MTAPAVRPLLRRGIAALAVLLLSTMLMGAVVTALVWMTGAWGMLVPWLVAMSAGATCQTAWSLYRRERSP